MCIRDRVYGKQDYSCFAGVGANCSNEKAITIGAGQWYAGEAKELLYRIQRANPKLFKDMDNAGMEKDLLMKSWDTYAVTAESAKGKCIVDIISTDLGKECQDQYMEDQIQAYIPVSYTHLVDGHKELWNWRNKLQRQATMECNNLLALIGLARPLFHLKGKKVKYWSEKTLKTRNYIKKWRESDQERYS